MADDLDYELRKTPEESAEPDEKRSTAIWLVASVIVVASATTVYFVGLRKPAAPVAAVEQVQPPATPSAQPLGGDATPISLPPLEETDALVRELVRMISSHPSVAAWLATDD